MTWDRKTARKKLYGALAVATVPVWGPAMMLWWLVRRPEFWLSLLMSVALGSLTFAMVSWPLAFTTPGVGPTGRRAWVIVGIVCSVPWAAVALVGAAYGLARLAGFAFRRGESLADADDVHPTPDDLSDDDASIHDASARAKPVLAV